MHFSSRFQKLLINTFIYLISFSGEALATNEKANKGLTLDGLFPNVKEVVLKQTDLKDKFFMFFKDQCSSCRRQVKDLSCLPQEKIFFMAMAFASTDKELQKEARLMGLWKRTYLADDKVKKSFRIKKDYSPQLFVFNKKGQVKKWLGETDCKSLKAFLDS